MAAAGMPTMARLMMMRTNANRTGAVPSAYAQASAGTERMQARPAASSAKIRDPDLETGIHTQIRTAGAELAAVRQDRRG